LVAYSTIVVVLIALVSVAVVPVVATARTDDTDVHQPLSTSDSQNRVVSSEREPAPSTLRPSAVVESSTETASTTVRSEDRPVVLNSEGSTTNSADASVHGVDGRIRRVNLTVTSEAGEVAVEVNNVRAVTREEVRIEGSQLYIRNRTVNVVPDTAVNRALERERISLDGLELRVDNEEPIYVVRGRRNVRILGFIPATMRVEVRVNAENGDVEQCSRPWWAFLARERRAEAVEEENGDVVKECVLRVIAVESGPAGLTTSSTAGVTIYLKDPSTGQTLDSQTTTADGVSFALELNQKFYVTTSQSGALGGEYGFLQELEGEGVPVFQIQEDSDGDLTLCRMSTGECSPHLHLILYRLKVEAEIEGTEKAQLKVIAVESGPAGLTTSSTSGVTIYLKDPSTGQTLDSQTTTEEGVSFAIEPNQQFYVTTSYGGATGGEYGFLQELEGEGVPVFNIQEESNGDLTLCRISTGECSPHLHLILYRLETAESTETGTEEELLKVIAVESGPAGVTTQSTSGVTIYLKDPTTGQTLDSQTTTDEGVAFSVEVNQQFYVTTSYGGATGGEYGFLQELEGEGVPVFQIQEESDGDLTLCRLSTGECSPYLHLILYRLETAESAETDTEEELLKVIAVESGPAGLTTPSTEGVTIYLKDPSTGQTLDTQTTTAGGVSFAIESNQKFYVTTSLTGAVGGEYGFLQELEGQGVPSYEIQETSAGLLRLCRVSTGECSPNLVLILYRIL
jgi:hypothetical protein